MITMNKMLKVNTNYETYDNNDWQWSYDKKMKMVIRGDDWGQKYRSCEESIPPHRGRDHSCRITHRFLKALMAPTNMDFSLVCVYFALGSVARELEEKTQKENVIREETCKQRCLWRKKGKQQDRSKGVKKMLCCCSCCCAPSFLQLPL